MEQEEMHISNGHHVERKQSTLSNPIKRNTETMGSHRREAAVFKEKRVTHKKSVPVPSEGPCLNCAGFCSRQGCDPVRTDSPISFGI